MTQPTTPEELSQFGVGPRDEYLHPHREGQKWWSESFCWDWQDDRGERAGHCWFSIHPNQNRVWLSLYILSGGEWIAIDEARLPGNRLEREPLGWSGFGLEFRYNVAEPLQRGALHVAGRGRAITGPRAGRIVPVTLDLAIASACPPHAHEVGRGCGRFEQPVTCQGTIALGEGGIPFGGLGTRDHTWGPRSWNMEWEILSLHGSAQRIRASVIKIPNVGRFASGHVLGESWLPVVEADFRFESHDDPAQHPRAGSVAIKTEDGTLITGRIEPISALEIDITHTDVSSVGSYCARALVHFHPEGVKRRRDSRPLLGWLETNHFVP